MLSWKGAHLYLRMRILFIYKPSTLPYENMNMSYRSMLIFVLAVVSCKGVDNTTTTPSRVEAWDVSPDRSTTRIKVTTTLSQQEICQTLEKALADKRLQIADRPYGEGRMNINDDGTTTWTFDSYRTKPKSTGNQSFFRLDMSIYDSVVYFSGDVGFARDIIVNPEYDIQWKTLERGDNFNSPFNTMNDLARTLGGTKLYNRLR